MSDQDFLGRLVMRTLDPGRSIQPRVPALFEPPQPGSALWPERDQTVVEEQPDNVSFKASPESQVPLPAEPAQSAPSSTSDENSNAPEIHHPVDATSLDTPAPTDEGRSIVPSPSDHPATTRPITTETPAPAEDAPSSQQTQSVHRPSAPNGTQVIRRQTTVPADPPRPLLGRPTSIPIDNAMHETRPAIRFGDSDQFESHENDQARPDSATALPIEGAVHKPRPEIRTSDSVHLESHENNQAKRTDSAMQPIESPSPFGTWGAGADESAHIMGSPMEVTPRHTKVVTSAVNESNPPADNAAATVPVEDEPRISQPRADDPARAGHDSTNGMTPNTVTSIRSPQFGSPSSVADESRTVHVHIGRIEIRATTPSALKKQKPRTSPSVMSLETYLRRRGDHHE